MMQIDVIVQEIFIHSKLKVSEHRVTEGETGMVQHQRIHPLCSLKPARGTILSPCVNPDLQIVPQEWMGQEITVNRNHMGGLGTRLDSLRSMVIWMRGDTTLGDRARVPTAIDLKNTPVQGGSEISC